VIKSLFRSNASNGIKHLNFAYKNGIKIIENSSTGFDKNILKFLFTFLLQEFVSFVTRLMKNSDPENEVREVYRR
jgi:hypothetical protein